MPPISQTAMIWWYVKLPYTTQCSYTEARSRSMSNHAGNEPFGTFSRSTTEFMVESDVLNDSRSELDATSV